MDAVERAGFDVIVKRLPPKGVSRQVSVDVEIAADVVAFSLGHSRFSDLSLYRSSSTTDDKQQIGEEGAHDEGEVQRIVTIVCPSRDLAYPISLSKELGVDTVSADFGKFNIQDVLKSAAKWIDLSDSETIWRE